jgi:Phospholipase D Active site motif
VYVHAKIAVIDDRWLTVGSANLNEPTTSPVAASIAACGGAAGAAERSARRRLTAFV